MSTLNAIYQVSADISALQSGVDRGVASMAKLEASAAQSEASIGKLARGASSLASSVGVGFSVAAVVGFASKVLDAADSIQKMADQTGLTTSEVQKLQYIAGQSGTGIGSLVTAVQTLQQRLGSGDAGTIGAIRSLNINLDEFNHMSTYQQMTLIADKIRDIRNPTLLAATAAEIFGKNWKEILPAIKSGMEDLGNAAPVMSDRVVQSLDQLGDRWEHLKGIVVVAAATTMAAFDNENDGIAENMRIRDLSIAQAERGAAAIREGYGQLPRIIAPTGYELGRLNRQLDTNREAMNRDNEAAKKLADEGLRSLHEWDQKLRESQFMGPLTPILVPDKLREIEAGTDDVATNLERIGQKTLDILPATQEWGASLLTVVPRMAGIRTEVSHLHDDIRGLGSIFEGLANTSRASFDTVEHSIMSAVNLAGRVMQARNLGEAAQAVNQTAQQAGAGPGTLATTGALAGALTAAPSGNPYVIAGAAAVGAVTGYIQGQENEQNQREALEYNIRHLSPSGDLAQGLLVLQRHAAAAGTSMREFWHAYRADDAESTATAIDHINERLERQNRALDLVREAAGRYGIELADMGPAMQRLSFDETAQQLYQDYSVISAAAQDGNFAVTHMAGALNDYFHGVLNAGVEVPEAMRPILQRMVDLGILTDINGTKVEHLEDTGVTFSQTMTEGFQTVVDAMHTLGDDIKHIFEQLFPDAAGKAEAAADRVRTAIDKIPSNKTIDIVYNQHGNPYEDPTPPEGVATGGLVGGSNILHFARGGIVPFHPSGIDSYPAMLAPGEMVLNHGQQEAIGHLMAGRGRGHYAGPSSVTVVVPLDGEVVARVVVPLIPDELYRRGEAA